MEVDEEKVQAGSSGSINTKLEMPEMKKAKDLNVPKNAQEVLDNLQHMTYHDRIEYSVKIGQSLKKDEAKVNEIIKDLRATPPPPVPQMETDEKLMEILKPQERDVGKNYPRHQVALVAAAVSNSRSDVLKEEIESQSKFFKKFAIGNYVKQEKDDSKIVELVEKSAPATQKKIIHRCVKEGRVSCLDLLADKMRMIAGIDFMVDFIHGCSDEKLKECMQFSAVKRHPRLRWDKIMKYHQKLVIEMMDEQLKEAPKNDYKYNQIFNQWTTKDDQCVLKSSKRSAWDELLQTGTWQSGALWELVLKYPHCKTCRDLDKDTLAALNKEVAENNGEFKSYKDARLHILLPDIVKKKIHYFTRRNPDLFLKFVDETTVKTIPRGRLRTSIPGSFWSNQEFDYKTVFSILDLVKNKSKTLIGDDSLLPYHKLWKLNHDYFKQHKRNLTLHVPTSSFYSATNSEAALAKFHYGKELREWLGYDYLLLCQITRNRHKYSIFDTFSPHMVNQLIKWAFDWFAEIEPKKSDEHHLYDYMGWVEMQQEWIYTWLTRLHLKRNVKTNENRYQECIDSLLNIWSKLWDKFVTCEWRERGNERLKILESLEYRLYHIREWYNLKCKHETRNSATSEETSLAKVISDAYTGILRLTEDYCGLGTSVGGMENIEKIEKAINNWENRFTKYSQSIRINTSVYGKTMYSRLWPLRTSIESLYNHVATMLTTEQEAIKSWDWLVAYRAMRCIRKIRRSEKDKFLQRLYDYLWKHRPCYYFYSETLTVANKNGKDLKNFNSNSGNYFVTNRQRSQQYKVTAKRELLFGTWMKHWRKLYRNIGFEMLDESMCNKNTFINENYGWNVAKQSIFKIIDSLKYEAFLQCHVDLDAEISAWTKSGRTRVKYGIFRAGSALGKFQHKTFALPSICHTLMEYLCSRQVNARSKSPKVISVDLLNDLYKTFFDILNEARPPTRSEEFESWKRIYDANVRALLGRLFTFYNNTFESMQDWARERIKDPDCEKHLTEKEKQRRELTMESFKLSKEWINQLFNELYTYYNGYFRVHWNDDKNMLEEYRNILYSWYSHMTTMRVSTAEAVRSLNNNDEKHKSELKYLQTIMNSYSHSLTGSNIIRIGEALCETMEFFGSGDVKDNNNDDDEDDDDIKMDKRKQAASAVTDARESKFQARLKRTINLKATQFPRMHVDNCNLLKSLYEKMASIYDDFENDRMNKDRQALVTMCNLCPSLYKHDLYDPFIYEIIEKYLVLFEETQSWHDMALKLARQDDPWRGVHFDCFETVIKYLCHVIDRLEDGKKELIEKNEKHKAIAAMEGSGESKSNDDTVMTGKKKGSKEDNKEDEVIPGEYATVDEYETEITKLNDAVSKYIIQAFDFEFEYFEIAKSMRNDTIAKYVLETGKQFQKKYGKKEATRAQLMIEIESKLTPDVASGVTAFDLDDFDDKNTKRLLKLFQLLEHAPSSDFIELFNKIREMVIDELMNDEAKVQAKSFLNVLMRQLKSKVRCEHDDNWTALWQVLVEIRGHLEIEFDSLCFELLCDDHVKAEQRHVIFVELCKDDHLTFLSQKYNDLFVKLFGSVLDYPDKCTDETRKLANEHLVYFLDEKANRIIPDTMDQLLRYLDIRDHKCRNRLVKLADSNSVDQREAALRHLISATLLCKEADINTQMKRTINFFCTKLKNEAIDRREVGLEILFGELKNQNDLILSSDDCLQYLMEMLQDCLEVQDLDKNEDHKSWDDVHEHRILRHFLQLSVDAIEYSVRLFKEGNKRSSLNEKLFDFGFELQWRMCVFRKGIKEASEQFRLNLGNITKRHKALADYKKLMKECGDNEEFVLSKMEFDEYEHFYFVPSFETPFVKMLFASYEKRILKNNPEYLKNCLIATEYLLPIFNVLGSNWKECQHLKDLLNNLIEEFDKLEFELDFEGIVLRCAADVSKDMDDEIKQLLNKELQKAIAKVLDAILIHSKDEWYELSAIEEFLKALFKGLRVLHEHGHDFILEECQIILTKMLDDILEKACKDEKSKKEYKDDWQDKSICKLIIESCLHMLSCENYPRKHSGRFWSMQWEIHKVFRMRMMKVDSERMKKKTITKYENVENELYAFKWTLFGSYWKCNLDNLIYAMNVKERQYRKHKSKENDLSESVSKMAIDDKKGDDSDDDDDDDDGDAMRVKKDKDRDTVPTFFKTEEERDVFKYEAAAWCIDLAFQWIWGGTWFSAIESPARLLIESSDPSDPIAFMIVPTIKTFDTRSKSILKHRWHEVSVIVSIIEQVVRSLDILKYYKCDMEGLRIIETNHPAMLLMEKLIEAYHFNRSKVIKMKTKFSEYWFNIPVLAKYNDVMMYSRQIKKVLWRWWYYRSSVTPPSTERTDYTKAVCEMRRGVRAKARKQRKRKAQKAKEETAKLTRATARGGRRGGRGARGARGARGSRLGAIRARGRGRGARGGLRGGLRGGRGGAVTRAALVNETATTAAAKAKGVTIAEKNKIIRGKTNKDKPEQSVANKGTAIRELLSITKSAIYLRFVWSYLAEHDQLLLTQFIEEGSPFRGVFYRKPDARQLTRRQIREKKFREKYMLDRYEEKDEKKTETGRKLGVSGAMKKEELAKKSAKRGGGKEATRRMLGVTAAKRAEAPKEKEKLTVEEFVEREKREQEEFEAAFEEWRLQQEEDAKQNDNNNNNNNNSNKENKSLANGFDHRDIWLFEGCYQLQRLLPNQLLEIGRRHLLAAMNTNRGMPERVKSMIRWTLLPTTTYNDIVEFFNDNKKLPINLLEALLKGVMENDEVLAPMNYLLQPKFLSSQQARVAAFAIAKCVPHVHRTQYTKLLRAVLSGQRRNALKVTAYKQIMRMLIAQPSRTHVRMIQFEWDRDELHRDVRIVILRAALDWLRATKPIGFCSDAAWHILETAVTNPNIRSNIEIMTAIMGVTYDGYGNVSENEYKGLVLQPNIIEHLATFKEMPIPRKHCKRFAQLIVTLCDRVYTEHADYRAQEAAEIEAKKEAAKSGKDKKEEEEDIEVVNASEKKDGGDDAQAAKADDNDENEDEKVDKVGPYIVNVGKARCNDDIAFIAMKSLSRWTPFNEHTVKPAVRVLAETICDLQIEFVAHYNNGTQEVNEARFEMACSTLKDVLQLNVIMYSENRHEYLNVIPEIFKQFEILICETKLESLRDVVNYMTEEQKNEYCFTDKNAMARMYVKRAENRLHKFLAKLGSLGNVPIKFYYSLFMPLEEGSSRGMFVKTIMKNRALMLSNGQNMETDGYDKCLLHFMQDAMYYGCCDFEYGSAYALTQIQDIFTAIEAHKRYAVEKTQRLCDGLTIKMIKSLVNNALPKPQEMEDVDIDSSQKSAEKESEDGSYDAHIFESESYEQLRHVTIEYMFSHLKMDTSHYGTGKDGTELMNEICPLMLEYFMCRVQLLIASIPNDEQGGIKTSVWNKEFLTATDITNETDKWVKLGLRWFVAETHVKQTATLRYHNHGRNFFDMITNKCIEIDERLTKSNDDNERLTVSDWVWLNMFVTLFNDSPRHIVILYHGIFDKLIKLICNLYERNVVHDMSNPLKQHNFYSLSTFVSKIWPQLSYGLFLNSFEARRSEFVGMFMDWYFEIGDQQKARQKKRLEQMSSSKGKHDKKKSIFGSLRDAVMGVGTKQKDVAYDARWNNEILRACTMMVSQTNYCSVAWPLVKSKIVQFYDIARIGNIEEEEYNFTQTLAKDYFDYLKEESSVATYSQKKAKLETNDEVKTGGSNNDNKSGGTSANSSKIDLALLSVTDAKCEKLDLSILNTSQTCYSWLSSLMMHVEGKLSTETKRDERKYMKNLLSLLLQRAQRSDKELEKSEVLHYESMVTYHRRMMYNLLKHESHFMIFVLNNELQTFLDVMIDMCVNPIEDGKASATWDDAVKLLYSIVLELSPQYKHNKAKMSSKARKIIGDLFNKFINVPLKDKPLSSLSRDEVVNRNICLRLINTYNDMVCHALDHELANVLKYMIDMRGWHERLTFKNVKSIYYDYSFNLAAIVNNCFDCINPPNYLGKRSVNPITKALVSQFWITIDAGNDALRKGKELPVSFSVCCDLIWYFMSLKVEMLTQAFMDETLVKIFLWSIKYAANKQLSISSITTYVTRLTKYLSPLFSTDSQEQAKQMHNIAFKIFEELINHCIDLGNTGNADRILYDNVCNYCYKVLLSFTQSDSSIKYIIVTALKLNDNGVNVLSDIIYCLTVRQCLMQTTFNSNIDSDIIRLIGQLDSLSKVWGIDGSDESDDQKVNAQPPAKRRRKLVADAVTTDGNMDVEIDNDNDNDNDDMFEIDYNLEKDYGNLSEQALTLISRVFRRDFKHELRQNHFPLVQSENAMWNDYMMRLSVLLMSDGREIANVAGHKWNWYILQTRNLKKCGRWFIASWIKYTTNTPLRVQVNMDGSDAQFLKYFMDGKTYLSCFSSNTQGTPEEIALLQRRQVLTWLNWLIEASVVGSEESRELGFDKQNCYHLAKLTLKLVIDYGHHSCVKTSVIKEEMEEAKKAKEEENDDNDNNNENKENDNDEDMAVSTKGKTGGKGKTKGKDGKRRKKGGSDESVMWRPEYVQLLNRLVDYPSPFVKSLAKKIETVFVDFKSQTDAWNSELSKYVKAAGK